MKNQVIGGEVMKIKHCYYVEPKEKLEFDGIPVGMPIIAYSGEHAKQVVIMKYWLETFGISSKNVLKTTWLDCEKNIESLEIGKLTNDYHINWKRHEIKIRGLGRK